MDELEVANKQINVNIKENKHVPDGKIGDKEKKGFGFDQDDQKATPAQDTKKAAGRKFGEGGMSFTTRPTFSRKNGKIGNKGDFDAGLDDLDNGGSK